jgi:hypothetical protein
MRVSFRLIDTTAAEDATPTGDGTNTDISQIAQTHDGVEKLSAKWATLETGGWPLDGSCEIMPDDLSEVQTGWWSEVSDENGEFATDPKLTFAFSEDHSSVGFTVFFDNQHPREMTVTAYDALDSVIASETVTVTGLIQVVEMPVENYRKVAISFSGTLKPYQSVRVVEVAFGIVQIYDKANSTGGTILYEVSPRSETQPTGELTITIDNTDRKYNMRSPNSLYAYLQQGQPLDAEVGIDGEYIPMGRFYFAKSEAKDASMTAQITAYDWFYRLDKGLYRCGTNDTDTVENLVNKVINDSGLDITVRIPANIGSRVIGACIPIVSHREAIRLIAQAARCVAFINRDDELELAELAVGTPVDTLDGNNMRDYPEVSVDDRVNTVDVAVYALYQQSPDDETLYEGIVVVRGTQDVWIAYSEPGQSAAASVSGGTLNNAAYYLYGAKLNITAAGEVTITVIGKALRSSESICTLSDTEPNEIPQPLQIRNPLITTTEMAESVAAWVLSISRLVYPVTWRGNPALELMDTVTIEDAYGTDENAVIVKQQFSFDGTLSCETKAVG